MNELPHETYERITGLRWPHGKSETIRALLAIFHVTAPPASAEANLELQMRLLESEW